MRTHDMIAAVCLALGCSERAAVPAIAPTPATSEAVAENPAAAAAPQKSREEPPVNDTQFHARLLEIAGEYPGYWRSCKQIPVDAVGSRDFQAQDRNGQPINTLEDWIRESEDSRSKFGDLRFSRSTDLVAHGGKLYCLFAAKAEAYSFPESVYSSSMKDALKAGQARRGAPVGQVIVNEAWIPEIVEKEPADKRESVPRRRQMDDGEKIVHTPEIAYTRHQGKVYHAVEVSSLFIMFKLDPATPDIDRGWVYGTVAAKPNK